MWNDFGGGSNAGAGGGGFFNSPQNFGGVNTPGGSKAKKTNKRNSRTAPVVISQILSSSDDGLKIWGSEVQVACVVARILDIKPQSTKIVYPIEDMTGRMKAVLWADQDNMDSGEVRSSFPGIGVRRVPVEVFYEKSIPNVMVNTYVQIFGSVKVNKGAKNLIVFKMFNITDINLITCHYLQCINNRILMEAKWKGVKSTNDVEMTHASIPSNSMVVGMDMGGASAGLNPRQTIVFNLISASKFEHGTSRQDMQNALQNKMAKTELDKILEWMCGEGHIYSTIDEDHFRATDAS